MKQKERYFKIGLRSMKDITLLAVFLLLPVAQAASVDNATVIRLMFDRNYGEKVYIQLDKHQASPITCHSNSSWEFVLDISDPLGKSMYSSVLALYVSGKNAEFIGTGSCGLHDTIEDLRRIELK